MAPVDTAFSFDFSERNALDQSQNSAAPRRMKLLRFIVDRGSLKDKGNKYNLAVLADLYAAHYRVVRLMNGLPFYQNPEGLIFLVNKLADA